MTSMRVRKNISGRKGEQGVIITLVAVFVLFVLGAMAALSIDVVTLYTARSEAQLAADGAALAGARVLANSGMTSDTTGGLTAGAETLAINVATQVATRNEVGGRKLNIAEVTIKFNDTAPSFVSDPHITVQVQRKDLPTFFARIWGNQMLTVGASATAEAYNPWFASTGAAGSGPPVAPICVKPWLLPNIDPTQTTTTVPIFLPSGAINNALLVGQSWPNPTGIPTANPNGLYALCGGDCSGSISPPAPGQYYPGSVADFPAPTQALPSGTAGFNDYQLAVAGCVQVPISCGGNPSINIDTLGYAPPPARDSNTVQAASVLIHYTAPGDSDSIDSAAAPSPPFQFLGGNLNAVPGAINQPIVVSDSLVTIPVINYPPGTPVNPVQVIGFLQVFLNPLPTGTMPSTLPSVPPGSNQIQATIINMAGCGTSTAGNPILGNGASPVAVRLISPP